MQCMELMEAVRTIPLRAEILLLKRRRSLHGHILASCWLQAPTSPSGKQNARKLPAALVKKQTTPKKEAASKPSRSGRSQTPSKQQPSAAKGKRKAVNLLEDDDDDDDFEVICVSGVVMPAR